MNKVSKEVSFFSKTGLEGHTVLVVLGSEARSEKATRRATNKGASLERSWGRTFTGGTQSNNQP